ncbi:MAG: hypothetical protein HQL52_11615 [Magnetococcales bacterium]|nr:hypothetical protein [Magnetococcales bacterium]
MATRPRATMAAGLLLAALIGGFLYVARTVDLSEHRGRIIQILEAVTSHKISLKSVQWAPTGGLTTLELTEFEVHALDPSEPPVLQVNQAFLGISPTTFFHKKLKISSITLVAPQINIVKRGGTKLIKRAQETAELSNLKMNRELGLGLTDLAVGGVTIRDGILTIIDWEHPDGQTLIFDHLTMRVHDLSPHGASPLTASARFQSVPFTVNGQVGPLPKSLDPKEMPVMLSLEAKSLGLSHLSDTIPNIPMDPRAARSYFSTMFHGSLTEGLQTSSWLELDRLVLTPSEIPPDQAHSNEPIPLDIAVRQKSLLKLKDAVPTLEIQELFVYLDGSPLLDVKGQMGWDQTRQLDLTLVTLDSVGFDRFPLPYSFPLSGNSPDGMAHIKGEWPQSVVVDANLDLTRPAIAWPVSATGPSPIQKKAGIPLSAQAKFGISHGSITLYETAFTRPSVPDNRLELAGPLWPVANFDASGKWDLALLADYFPVAIPWDVEGLTQVAVRIEGGQGQPLLASGKLTAKRHRFGPLTLQQVTLPFRLEKDRLHLRQVQAEMGGGLLEATIVVDQLESDPVYNALVALSGTSLERLALFPFQDRFKLEGLLFGQGSVMGALDRELIPTRPFSGQASLRLEPGRAEGLDGAVFLSPILDGTSLSSKKKSFFWNRLETDLIFQNDHLTFQDLTIDAGGLHIRGEGGKREADKKKKNDQDHYWFQLMVEPEWLATPPSPIEVEGPLEKLIMRTIAVSPEP